MNKKQILVIIMLMLLVIFIILTCIFINKEVTNEIILRTNGGVPFKWECNVQDKSIIKISDTYSKDLAKKNVSGGPVEVHYVLKGIKKGNTKVICKYYNFINNRVSEEKIYNVYVDKNLNIQIK